MCRITSEMLLKIVEDIYRRIPVGFNHHKHAYKWYTDVGVPDIEIIKSELQFSEYQIGTLGGGNHFIEIQKDESNRIWVMIHSGSRNFGYKIAKHFGDIANEKCKQWHARVPINGDESLAFLPVDTKEGQDYLTSMDFALKFAKQNRLKMLYTILDIFNEHRNNLYGFNYNTITDIHHNYASMEYHLGKNVRVHRKGAISARNGIIGIIPGSQGTSSYIVEGLANPESFESCSHGAGRKLSRTEAKKLLSVKEQSKMLDNKGILHSIKSEKDLDEAPDAYKDIDIVMEEQRDLVKIVHKLEPLAVIKG